MPPLPDRLKKEDDDFLLNEDGFFVLLEKPFPASTPQRLSDEDNPNGIGCLEEYTVIITGRDLESFAAELKFSELTWTRSLDEISSCTVTVPDRLGGLRCVIELGGALVPWRFGIRIERNGQLVWTGPITGVTRNPRGGPGDDSITIRAQDKMAWMKKRVPTDYQLYTLVDAGTVFKEVLEQGTAQDNVFNLECPSFVTGWTVTREIVPTDFEYVSDTLDDLAKSAVDWFMFAGNLVVLESPGGIGEAWVTIRNGQKVQFAPTQASCGRYVFGLFTDDAWTTRPGYDFDGDSQANVIYVPGGDFGEAGFRAFWSAAAPNLVDGVLTHVEVNSLYRPSDGLPVDSTIFQRNADSLLAARRTTPVILSGGQINQRAPVRVDQLITGCIWGVDLAEKNIAQLLTVQRLKSVSFNVSVSSDGLTEQIAPTLIPIGSCETGAQ